MPATSLQEVIDYTFNTISTVTQQHVAPFGIVETGVVKSVSEGIAKVSGLPGTELSELLKFPGNLYGIAFQLDEDETGVVLLGNAGYLQSGSTVERTGRVTDIPVGEGLLGRVVTPLGEPLDGKGPVSFSRRYPVERPAPAIMDRAPVIVPLQTGIKVIDALVPIGRGQRQLIMGDRQTGKTSIALDTMLNQHDKNVVCVYCAIGQRASSVARVIARLGETKAIGYSVVVVAGGNDAPGLQYIAPYAATSIAEYFMEQGKDVLVIYDDLAQHARAYRELSLLLRRPPGREAFPGDIFYIHSRLLERATHLSQKLGGGSLTALPVIETEAQNISAYIPTNLISITDGQVYLSPRLFELGVLPAVDTGKSVSRVGGKAQLPAYRAAAGDLKLAYAQFSELESFARFGTRLDDNTKQVITHGNAIREAFKQPESEPVPVIEQILLLVALTIGLFDVIAADKIREACKMLARETKNIPDSTVQRLLSGSALSTEDKAVLENTARQALDAFNKKSTSHG